MIRSPWLASLCAAFLLVTACHCGDPAPADPPGPASPSAFRASEPTPAGSVQAAPSSTPKRPKNSAARSKSAGASDGGRILVRYEKPSDPNHREIYRILKGNKLFDQLGRGISRRFELPEDVQVVFTDCEEDNAFYDPETATITMCYELIDNYRLIYTDETSPPEEVEAETVNAALFTFYHELGHALVDLLEIPAPGREEDVVDEFAAIMLLESDDDQGVDAVIAAIDQFAVDAEQTSEEHGGVDDLPYADVHSLDQQRMYDLLCLLYGSDPEYFSDIVDEGHLPEERAEGCEEEFERKAAAWDALLAPHLRGTSPRGKRKRS